MHDLLNEEDFTKEKKFNPWKRVAVCCGIGMVQALVFFVFILSNNTFTYDGLIIFFYRLWTLLNIVFPLLLAFGMIFQGKKMIKLPLKTLLLSLLCLGSAYSLVVVLGEFFNAYMNNIDVQMNDTVISIGVGMAYFVVFCITVLPAVRYKAKNIKS